MNSQQTEKKKVRFFLMPTKKSKSKAPSASAAAPDDEAAPVQSTSAGRRGSSPAEAESAESDAVDGTVGLSALKKMCKALQRDVNQLQRDWAHGQAENKVLRDRVSSHSKMNKDRRVEMDTFASRLDKLETQGILLCFFFMRLCMPDVFYGFS